MMEELEVIEILSTAYDGDEFPGYENIRLSFSQLETIIRNKRSGWLDALRNQKAVYLITDTSNGKMYVGSATAQYGMLLQRWTNYMLHCMEKKTGHFLHMKEMSLLSITIFFRLLVMQSCQRSIPVSSKDIIRVF